MPLSALKKFAVLLKPRDDQPALDRAAQYARMNPDLEIVAVRVVNDYKDPEKDQIKIKEETNFEQLRRSYSIENLNFRLVFSRNVAEGFLKECHDGDYNLAIISANKRNSIKDLFVSNIDSAIMRQSEVPVLVVRDAKEQDSVGNAVILAIDFQEAAKFKKLDDYLFNAAEAFARSFDGDLHVANCVVPHNVGRMAGNLSSSKIVKDTGIDNPLELCFKLADDFADRHQIDNEHVHVLQGRVDEEIPRLCKRLKARMVCMGTTPRSTFLGTVNSSASELVLEQINGDVFIVNAETLKDEND